MVTRFPVTQASAMPSRPHSGLSVAIAPFGMGNSGVGQISFWGSMIGLGTSTEVYTNLLTISHWAWDGFKTIQCRLNADDRQPVSGRFRIGLASP